jgi:uncharacterized protein (DUF111 family)
MGVFKMAKREKLYLECRTGISGDMMVAALLDLGADQAKLERVLKSLQIEGYSVGISHPTRGSLAGCDFCVDISSTAADHKHDRRSHSEHRGLSEIHRLIDEADLTPNARRIAPFFCFLSRSR